MNREDLKNLWFLWKAVYRQEKKTMCMVILSAILTAINSYILLVLLGYIIDVGLVIHDDDRCRRDEMEISA